MPKLVKTVESNVLIQRWRQRRRDILKTLPANLLTEYRELGIALRRVQAEQLQISKDRRVQSEGAYATEKESGLFVPPPRIPLATHRKKLIEFLSKHGQATRTEITAKTGIPAGSLSELLSGDEFKQLQRGFWALKNQVEITDVESDPGTSATTAK